MGQRKRGWKQLALAITCAVIVAAISAMPWFARFHALDIDILHALRHATEGKPQEQAGSDVVVVAIDEYTHRTAPFAGLPKVMWTTRIAAVQDALLDAGARVVGWDLILPTSAASYVNDRNFDRPLLQSLARGAKQQKIVLGMADIGTTPIKPHGLYTWAVGGNRNIRLLNVKADADGVIRRMPVFFEAKGKDGTRALVPSLATELAQRQAAITITAGEDGRAQANGRHISGTSGNGVLLNFNPRASSIETFSLADLHACAAEGKRDFFSSHFDGKTVLLGLVLDIEDRKLSSARLFTDGNPPGPVRGCTVHPSVLGHDLSSRRETLPGVYLHAVAVNNLIQGNGLNTLPSPLIHLPAIAGTLLTSLAATYLALPATIAAITIGLGAWLAAALFAFGQNLVLPLVIPIVAALVTLTMVFAMRFTFLDKDARFLRKAFASYMAPALVEQLVQDPDRLTLSGERREMTFLFTDLAGFTRLIEKQKPEEAVTLLNEYLAEMVAISKRHGGTLDKVVGDALHIIFSAPLDQSDHAQRAVDCALEMDRFANEFSERQLAAGIPFGETRIGINTGSAIIGNFGGNEFFDYTAHGDAINTAARLESVNKQFGTRIAISATTVEHCPDFVGRKIGKLVLKGKTRATEVFEPICNPETQKELFDAYGKAYGRIDRNAKEARSQFSALAKRFPEDGLTRYHLERLKAGERSTTIHLASK